MASVTAKEERQFGEVTQQFYIIELDSGGTLMVPVGNVSRTGVRKLVSQKDARRLFKMVEMAPETEITNDHASRKKRADIHAEALRSGVAVHYTEVLRELLFRSRSERLSAGDQRSLNAARAYFVGEIAGALNMTASQVEAHLDAVPSF